MEGVAGTAHHTSVAGTLVLAVPPDRVERGVLGRAVRDAARWELDEVVAFVVVPARSFGWLWSLDTDEAGDVRAVRGVVADRLGRTRSPVPLRLHVVAGRPVAALTESSAGAFGLYLGRGRATAPGAIALGCALSALCPVTVVPRQESGPSLGPVVVGLDDSHSARSAVEHALEEGARSGRAVLVVSVIESPLGAGPEAHRAVEVRSRATVHDLVARRARARRPDVAVEVEVLEGVPAVVLCEVASRSAASLLVLGARGRGRAGGRGTPTGAVATGVLLRARGAVRIVRNRHRR